MSDDAVIKALPDDNMGVILVVQFSEMGQLKEVSKSLLQVARVDRLDLLIIMEDDKLLRAWSLGPRILVCSMLRAEGQEICAISAHFSHRPGKHGAQWRKLLSLLVTIPCEHKILMADHNSLIVPSRDSNPVYEDKNKTILEARATRTQILQKLQLEDAYVSVHFDPLDR